MKTILMIATLALFPFASAHAAVEGCSFTTAKGAGLQAEAAMTGVARGAGETDYLVSTSGMKIVVNAMDNLNAVNLQITESSTGLRTRAFVQLKEQKVLLSVGEGRPDASAKAQVSYAYSKGDQEAKIAPSSLAVRINDFEQMINIAATEKSLEQGNAVESRSRVMVDLSGKQILFAVGEGSSEAAKFALIRCAVK